MPSSSVSLPSSFLRRPPSASCLPGVVCRGDDDNDDAGNEGRQGEEVWRTEKGIGGVRGGFGCLCRRRRRFRLLRFLHAFRRSPLAFPPPYGCEIAEPFSRAFVGPLSPSFLPSVPTSSTRMQCSTLSLSPLRCLSLLLSQRPFLHRNSAVKGGAERRSKEESSLSLYLYKQSQGC